ncbi:unnamed protein product [uncultured virus]|nr:unnamed protein product [uncultured virus]
MMGTDRMIKHGWDDRGVKMMGRVRMARMIGTFMVKVTINTR